MEVREIKVRGTKFRFVCEGYSNSRAWGHRVVLFENGREMADVKIRYYNRTWECYTFQTTMQKAVRELQEWRENRIIEDYKYSNNISKLPKGKKEELFKDDDSLKTYKLLLKRISGYSGMWN